MSYQDAVNAYLNQSEKFVQNHKQERCLSPSFTDGDIELNYSTGQVYSSWTYEDASLKVVFTGTCKSCGRRAHYCDWLDEDDAASSFALLIRTLVELGRGE
jgi:hypothetical protein